MAYVHGPLNHYLVAQLELVGFESAIRSKLEASKAFDGDLRAFFVARKYPLLRAASGDLENKCMAELANLHHNSKILLALPDPWKTVTYNHLLFKLLSRGGASMHKNLRV